MEKDEIIKELGFENAPQQIKDDVVAKVHVVVRLRLINTLDSLMTDEQRDRFEQLIDKESDDAILAWLKDEFTDVSDIYEALLRDYVNDKKAQAGSV